MAQRVLVQLVDDLDGGEATETVRFAIDGTGYEIDLSAKNAAKLREEVAVYAEKSRRAGTAAKQPRRQAPRTAAPASGASSQGTVREWAKAKGIPVNGRGRLPLDVLRQFEVAGGK